VALRQTAQILIVDSDLEASRIVHKALQDHGHQAHLATDAQIALEFARDAQPEIVILDSYANFGRGLELIPTLFEASPASPIVVTTADPTIGAEIAAREQGAFDVLVKPFRDLNLLSQRFNVAIQTSRALRERDEVIKDLSQNTGTVQQLQAHVQELSEKLAVISAKNVSGVDDATGLLTENAFMERLKNESTRSLRYSRPVTVGLAHIDGYKTIFSRFGEEKANIIRQSVATVLKTSLRDIDVAGLFDSGELGFILPETDKPSGYIASERIREHVETSLINFEGRQLQLTVTIGYASLPTDTMNSNGLLASARGACQAAATIGVNQVLGFRG
jgi:diguanylate cyclase (GGDEF)-like protein